MSDTCSASACFELRRPLVELVGVHALHHDAEVLVAHAAADLQRRRQADESLEAGEAEQRRADLLRDLLRGHVALRPRHQLHHDAAVVRAAARSAADAGQERIDVLVLDDDVGDVSCVHLAMS